MKRALLISFGSILIIGGVWWVSFLKSAPTTVITSYPAPRTEIASTTYTVIAFGDSITAGYGLSPSDAYPAVLEVLLREQGYNVRVINAGVSGETTAGGLRRAEFIAQKRADVVVLALGGNDMLRGTPPETVDAQLRQILTILTQDNGKVVLVGMRASQNLGPVYISEFDALYPRLAQEFGVTLVPFLLEGVALDPNLNQADGIHPNEAGARIIAHHIILPAVLLHLEK
jgi:acyl-CoA thioesterase I